MRDQGCGHPFCRGSEVRELAVVFLDESPKLMEQIRAAIAVENATLLRLAAHGLKGSIDNFAAAQQVLVEEMTRELRGRVAAKRGGFGPRFAGVGGRSFIQRARYATPVPSETT